MFKKIKLIASDDSFYYRGHLQHRLQMNEIEECHFNMALVKKINLIKVDKKKVFKIQLTDDETVFALPFKL